MRHSNLKMPSPFRSVPGSIALIVIPVLIAAGGGSSSETPPPLEPNPHEMAPAGPVAGPAPGVRRNSSDEEALPRGGKNGERRSHRHAGDAGLF